MEKGQNCGEKFCCLTLSDHNGKMKRLRNREPVRFARTLAPSFLSLRQLPQPPKR